MKATDKVLDTVNDLIVEHDFEVINGEDFGKYVVKQHEFDYDAVDIGYGFCGSIKTGKIDDENKQHELHYDDDGCINTYFKYQPGKVMLELNNRFYHAIYERRRKK